MKRSELLDKISKITMCHSDAEKILTLIENEGMLPPSRKLTFYEIEAVRGFHNKPFDFFHQWDEETPSEIQKTWSDDEIPF